jgi:hypothetical protein
MQHTEYLVFISDNYYIFKNKPVWTDLLVITQLKMEGQPTPETPFTVNVSYTVNVSSRV